MTLNQPVSFAQPVLSFPIHSVCFLPTHPAINNNVKLSRTQYHITAAFWQVLTLFSSQLLTRPNVCLFRLFSSPRPLPQRHKWPWLHSAPQMAHTREENAPRVRVPPFASGGKMAQIDFLRSPGSLDEVQTWPAQTLEHRAFTFSQVQHLAWGAIHWDNF